MNSQGKIEKFLAQQGEHALGQFYAGVTSATKADVNDLVTKIDYDCALL